MPELQRYQNSTDPSLLVYGSLMHRDELARYSLQQRVLQPVVVSGLTRDFGQEPSWRGGQGHARGVLTVRAAAGGFVNAVLIAGVSDDLLSDLDHRERGYIRRRIPPDSVAPFRSLSTIQVGGPVFVYTGRPEHHDPMLQPNPDYLSLCLDAAAAWGDRFRRMFLETTYVIGRPLASAHV